MLDIVSYLRDEATTRGWELLCVNQMDEVYNLDSADWTDGAYKLIVSLDGSRPVLENQRRNGRYTENIELSLGRKFDIETDTVSDIGEPFVQKYDNRLSDLRTDLDQFLLDTIDLHVSIEEISSDYSWALNVGAVKVDLAVAKITIETW
jgi:hypothetical protein